MIPKFWGEPAERCFTYTYRWRTWYHPECSISGFLKRNLRRTLSVNHWRRFLDNATTTQNVTRPDRFSLQIVPYPLCRTVVDVLLISYTGNNCGNQSGCCSPLKTRKPRLQNRTNSMPFTEHLDLQRPHSHSSAPSARLWMVNNIVYNSPINQKRVWVFSKQWRRKTWSAPFSLIYSEMARKEWLRCHLWWL